MSGSLRPLLVTLGLSLLFGLAFQTDPLAKEATKRGRNATIIWTDENGMRQETRGGEIRYGYFTRALLSVPKEGNNYRDDEHQSKGLSFASKYFKFSRISRIDFRYVKTVDPAGTRLEITITPLSGKPFTESGNTLSGAAHSSTPFITFLVDKVEQRIGLYPLATDKERTGRPMIVSADFKL